LQEVQEVQEVYDEVKVLRYIVADVQVQRYDVLFVESRTSCRCAELCRCADM
jgi:hypothetical protein